MRRAILLLVLICGSVSSATIVEWSTGVGGNGHLYEAVEAQLGISWTEARDAAISKGGYLVTLTSQAENDFVFGLIGLLQVTYSRRSSIWGVRLEEESWFMGQWPIFSAARSFWTSKRCFGESVHLHR